MRPKSSLTDEKLGNCDCVGIYGFPGATLPRIAGLIRFRDQDAEQYSVKILARQRS